MQANFLDQEDLSNVRLRIAQMVQKYRAPVDGWKIGDIKINDSLIVWPDGTGYPYSINFYESSHHLGNEIFMYKDRADLSPNEVDSITTLLKKKAYYLYYPFDKNERHEISVKLTQVREVANLISTVDSNQFEIEVSAFNLSASPDVVRKKGQLIIFSEGQVDTLSIFQDESSHIREHGYKTLFFRSRKIAYLKEKKGIDLDKLMNSKIKIELNVIDLKKKRFFSRPKLDKKMVVLTDQSWNDDESESWFPIF